MTDKQILEMIAAEKHLHNIARSYCNRGEFGTARCFQDEACDLTVRIDHAHFEQEAGL